MTDYTDLIARLRSPDCNGRVGIRDAEAADALEKQARRIAELEYMNNSILSVNNELGFAFTERDEARARIAELEAALKQSARVEASLASRIANLMDALEPFAEYAEQMADDADRWSVETSDLRAARVALEKKND